MGGFAESIIYGIPIIGVLILVHELGHFLVAKWCGVGVVRFSIGFGPVLWKRQWGETEYQIGAIPLGGYVRMLGDMPDLITGEQETDAEVREEAKGVKPGTNDRSRWFIEKGYWPRSAIVIAGPLFNFVLAILVAALTVIMYGRAVPKNIPEIGVVQEGSPAEKSGLRAGDAVLEIDGKKTDTWESVSKGISSSEGSTISLVVRRQEQGTVETIVVQPLYRTVPGPDGGRVKRHIIGIEAPTEREPATITQALKDGSRWTWTLAVATLDGIAGMITGDVSTKEIGGPIMIFATARQQAKKGLEQALLFVAALSVSLAVLNLLPIPLLDGGHLLFFTLEAIIGPLSMRKKEFAQNVGLMFLLLLMFFALFNDVGRVVNDDVTPGPWSKSEEEHGEQQGEAAK